MPKYQLLCCRIALSGDVGNVVVRSPFRPITYPELIVLNVLHGESSISKIEDCGEVECSRDEEFRRLADLYGDQVMKMLFPGHAIQIPERGGNYPKSEITTPPPTPPDDDGIDPQIVQGQVSKPRVPAPART